MLRPRQQRTANEFVACPRASDNFNRWASSTVLNVEVAEGWNAPIEYFGIDTDGRGNELSSPTSARASTASLPRTSKPTSDSAGA
jgi:hypothetical protein